MHAAPRRPGRLAAVLCALLAVALVAAPAAGAQSGASLDRHYCGQPPDVQPSAVQCAMQTVPLDYDSPTGSTIQNRRRPRAGEGPGASHRVAALQPRRARRAGGRLPAGDRRPRGSSTRSTGASTSSPSIPAARARARRRSTARRTRSGSASTRSRSRPRRRCTCARCWRKDRAYFARCLSLVPRSILAHVSTADVARDMDVLRQAVGDSLES